MTENRVDPAQPKASRSVTIDDGLQKPGDVIINQLLLNTVSSDVALDLKPYMMEFHLYVKMPTAYSPFQIIWCSLFKCFFNFTNN